MTIALGFRAPDGIVLCTDSQMTKEGGLKFNDKKIFNIVNERWTAGIAFAGSADLMKNIVDELDGLLSDLERDGPPVTVQAQMCLEQVAESFSKKYRDKVVEFLFGISDGLYGKALFSVRGKVVSRGEREYIGVGDSSVIRYLAGLFGGPMDASQCLLLACYMVHQAKEFIDQCGGPIQTCVLNKGYFITPDSLANHADYTRVEQSLSRFLFYVSSKGTSRQQKQDLLRDFWKEMQEFDWTRELDM